MARRLGWSLSIPAGGQCSWFRCQPRQTRKDARRSFGSSRPAKLHSGWRRCLPTCPRRLPFRAKCAQVWLPARCWLSAWSRPVSPAELPPGRSWRRALSSWSLALRLAFLVTEFGHSFGGIRRQAFVLEEVQGVGIAQGHAFGLDERVFDHVIGIPGIFENIAAE